MSGIMYGSEARELPGFVDLQVNGHIGVDFSSEELDEDGFVAACRDLRMRGTVVFLVTFVSIPIRLLERNAAIVLKACRIPEIRDVCFGFHVEGPFLDPAEGSRGAHLAENIRPPDPELWDRIHRACKGKLRILTVAAGQPGIEEVIAQASNEAVVVALGHHNASADAISAAVDAGATLHTHLGNGIPNLLDRTNNALYHTMVEDRLMASVITDGHHLPESFVRAVWRTKGPERLIVVSDQSSIAGLPPGDYRTLGNHARLEPDGRLHNPDAEHLVGSATTLAECIAHLAGLRLACVDDLVAVGYSNPLRLLGADLTGHDHLNHRGPGRIRLTEETVEVLSE